MRFMVLGGLREQDVQLAPATGYGQEMQRAGVLLALGSYWIIEVRSRDEALEWARRCPVAGSEVVEFAGTASG